MSPWTRFGVVNQEIIVEWLCRTAPASQGHAFPANTFRVEQCGTRYARHNFRREPYVLFGACVGMRFPHAARLRQLVHGDSRILLPGSGLETLG